MTAADNIPVGEWSLPYDYDAMIVMQINKT